MGLPRGDYAAGHFLKVPLFLDGVVKPLPQMPADASPNVVLRIREGKGERNVAWHTIDRPRNGSIAQRDELAEEPRIDLDPAAGCLIPHAIRQAVYLDEGSAN